MQPSTLATIMPTTLGLIHDANAINAAVRTLTTITAPEVPLAVVASHLHLDLASLLEIVALGVRVGLVEVSSDGTALRIRDATPQRESVTPP